MTKIWFLLEEDGQPRRPPFETVQDAKEAGEELVTRGLPLLITRLSGMVASVGWRYDYEVSDWVETPLP
ncbi:hypothetical protein SAMN06265365_14240 [Tistlia consotensis]|uniref:Uncharacterized protein n=1 Tax=Tistlia consotensis USBA 355 TaxID=560819 RepID=A0A1Y6CR05_9PROT|nr:hypothetical protein [Tistlia consotensis]SMF82158.1 hypothetical protein SAMN05428998_14540 [Tistlia consotensis USBA 355]SNS25734.1 hypothetical protein SAMN06265365_14240 [Tistlia consotensis]